MARRDSSEGVVVGTNAAEKGFGFWVSDTNRHESGKGWVTLEALIDNF